MGRKKKAFVRFAPVLLFLPLLMVCGCATTQQGNGAVLVNGTFSSATAPEKSSMETFRISYPDWPEGEAAEDALVMRVREDQVCNFRLSALNAPPNWYETAMDDYVAAHGGGLVSEGPPYTLRLPTEDGAHAFIIKAKGMLCDDKSYFAVFSCIEGMFDDGTAGLVFDSMDCEKVWEVHPKKSKKLAMVVSPPGTEPQFSDFMTAFSEARNSGVELVHNTVAWGDVEKEKGTYDWTTQDFMMDMIRSKGLRTTAGFRTIHTSVVGTLPAGTVFRGFDDPEFVSGFTDFALDYIDRYRDVISYVMIGNEVDIYLHANPGELDAYASFYGKVYDAIKEEYPDLQVGTIFAYHELRRNGDDRMYDKLAIGDFDAFTLYIYGDGFTFDRDPSEILTYLREIEDMTGNRSYAMTEVGWSTAPALSGTEPDQAEAVGYFFDYLEEAPERLEFLSYFALHDWTKEDCLKSGETFFVQGNPWLQDSEYMDVFSDFLCYMGVLKNDGTPKQAWDVWASRGKAYAQSAGMAG